MNNSQTYEIRNLGISILVPFSALLITSFYVMRTSETSAYDMVVGRIVAAIVLGFFTWNCVLSFQKGRFLSPDGDPSRGTSEDTRTGPIWAFICAFAMLGLVVSLSGPSRVGEIWKQRLSLLQTSSSVDAASPSAQEPNGTLPATTAAPEAAPPVIGPDGLPVIDTSGAAPPETPATDADQGRKFIFSSFMQIVLLCGLASVLVYFSVHISRLDNRISGRDTSLISHSAIYFVITFLNTLVLGSPLLLGFLAQSVPDWFFNLAVSGRTLLLVMGIVFLTVDALRVFSASRQKMLAIVMKWTLSLPVRQSGASGLFSAIGLLMFVIGRVVRILVNVVIGIVVWIYVLAYYFIAAFFTVVRTTVFSWALLFALIHSIAFGLLALALLEAPQALTYVREYFASGDMAPAIKIGTAIGGALFISILAAVIAYISVHFSWPTAFVTTIPELIAYTLIAVWLNTVVLHSLKSLLGIGPDIFGWSLSKLGPTFWIGVGVGLLAAIMQSGPSPARAAKLKSGLDLPVRAGKVHMPFGLKGS